MAAPAPISPRSVSSAAIRAATTCIWAATADGSRLNRIYQEDADEETILATLAPLFADYAQTRQNGEGFGDFVVRRGVV